VQGGPRLGRAQVGAEDSLDAAEALVKGGPGQVRGPGRGRLVAPGSQVGGQHVDEPGRWFLGEQCAEFPLDERLQARVVAQQVDKPAEAQVGQPVERRRGRPLPGNPGSRGIARIAIVTAFGGHVGDLGGLKERTAHVPDRADRLADPDDQQVRIGAEAVTDPGGEPGERVVGLGPRAEREHGPGAGVIQGPDQRGDPLGPARGGRRVGQVEDPGVGGNAERAHCPARPGGLAEPQHHGDELAPVDRYPQRP
jgi:hypothetical protein